MKKLTHQDLAFTQFILAVTYAMVNPSAVAAVVVALAASVFAFLAFLNRKKVEHLDLLTVELAALKLEVSNLKAVEAMRL